MILDHGTLDCSLGLVTALDSARGDLISSINTCSLKLYSNHITMMLKYVNVLLCYVGFICVVFLIIESQILVMETKKKEVLVESVRRKLLVYVFL